MTTGVRQPSSFQEVNGDRNGLLVSLLQVLVPLHKWVQNGHVDHDGESFLVVSASLSSFLWRGLRRAFNIGSATYVVKRIFLTGFASLGGVPAEAQLVSPVGATGKRPSRCYR